MQSSVNNSLISTPRSNEFVDFNDMNKMKREIAVDDQDIINELEKNFLE